MSSPEHSLPCPVPCHKCGGRRRSVRIGALHDDQRLTPTPSVLHCRRCGAWEASALSTRGTRMYWPAPSRDSKYGRSYIAAGAMPRSSGIVRVDHAATCGGSVRIDHAREASAWTTRSRCCRTMRGGMRCACRRNEAMALHSSKTSEGRVQPVPDVP